MKEESDWQISNTASEVYERLFVPALVGQWAPRVVETARIDPGDRVLDVGCGTGVLARAAADRVAVEEQITGFDHSDGMLAVARRIRPRIDWRQGDASALPFADRSFDVVMSQFALMYFPDRTTALREMARVLRPGGRLAIAVWGPFERATSYVILTEIARRRCGPAAADVLTSPFVLGDEARLVELFRSAGIDRIAVALHAGTMTFPSIATFVEAEARVREWNHCWMRRVTGRWYRKPRRSCSRSEPIRGMS
jgi:ubiquinone/menaquinone biosynthesis C-methylase UbiE